MTEDDPYLCVGICMADPDSGYCVGCGRPPLPMPPGAVVVEVVKIAAAEPPPGVGDPDTPA